MKRIFSTPAPKELFPQSTPNGCYRLDKSTEAILEARQRKRQSAQSSNWQQPALEVLALVVSVALAVFLCLWAVCAGNDPKTSAWAFCASLWAFAGLMGVCGVILAVKHFRK